MTSNPEPLSTDALTVEAHLAEKDARIAVLEGVVVAASRNARAQAQTTTHFQNETVRLGTEVRRLTPTVYKDAAAAAAEPPTTLFIDSAGEVYQVYNGGVMQVGVDITVGIESMVYPVKIITGPNG